ncbi:hypothetical protein ABZ756_03830 [Mammaliicoccus sciuri]
MDELQLNVYVQALFTSIKTALDRIIPLLTFYYSGVSLESTFGRIKENGKTKGLMSVVIQLKDNDDIMEFIYDLLQLGT